MNVEAQTINVPDRPAGLSAGALRRRRRARARRRRHPPRPARRRSRASSSAASSSATPASRGTPAPTTGRSPRSTSTATATSSTASSASATPRPRCATALARGDWDARRPRTSPTEWDNRKRLAPGVTTPAIDGLIARAPAAGATAAKVCGAGGGGCLFCYGPPDARAAIRDALAGRRRAPARLHDRAPRPHAWITTRRAGSRRRSPTCSRSRARTPFKIRAYRIRRRHDRRLGRPGRADGPSRSCASCRASARTSRRRSASSPTPASCALPPGAAAGVSRRRSSTCCGCRASARRRSRCSTPRSNIRSLDELAAAARDGPPARAQGHGRRRRKR